MTHPSKRQMRFFFSLGYVLADVFACIYPVFFLPRFCIPVLLYLFFYCTSRCSYFVNIVGIRTLKVNIR